MNCIRHIATSQSLLDRRRICYHKLAVEETVFNDDWQGQAGPIDQIIFWYRRNKRAVRVGLIIDDGIGVVGGGTERALNPDITVAYWQSRVGKDFRKLPEFPRGERVKQVELVRGQRITRNDSYCQRNVAIGFC